MVRVRSGREFNGTTYAPRWIVDDGEVPNGRMVESVRAAGNIIGHTEEQWFIFPDAYLSFVGNRAIIHPNPTPITKALNEVPLRGVDDGS